MSGLVVPLKSFQSLQERIAEGFPVGRAERIEQGVDGLMIGRLHGLVHTVKGIAYDLRERHHSDGNAEV